MSRQTLPRRSESPDTAYMLSERITVLSSTGEEVPENAPRHEQPNQNKKRKRARGKVAGQPPHKKVRGKLGILKATFDMPFDVLFEIFGRLEPLDLLSLARMSKDLRPFLMSRSSISIWKAAHSNIEGLPKCPPDLSEPQYANLAFAKMCHFCSRTNGTIHVVWSSRLRTCTKCLEERFQSNFVWYTKDHPGFSKLLHDFVPSITISKPHERSLEYHFLEAVRLWKEEYKNAADKDQLVSDKTKEQAIIKRHSVACERWADAYQALL